VRHGGAERGWPHAGHGRALRRSQAGHVGTVSSSRHPGRAGRREPASRRGHPRVRDELPRSRRGPGAGAHVRRGPARHRVSGARRQRGPQRLLPRPRPPADPGVPLPGARSSGGGRPENRAPGSGTPGSAGGHLVRDFPAAVVQSWAYVFVALILFAAPAGIGYGLIRAHPELQDELVMPVMVSRARQAAENQARGIGYAESPREELPVLASTIMSNNIGIGFWAFVGGLLLGLPTVWVLVTNGLSLGTGFGVFANYHAGGYLGTFVAGHGVLELTAIFIAG